MKKNTLQKFLAITLAGVMAMGMLTACGNNTPTDSSTSGSEAPASNETPSDSAEEAPAVDDVAGMEGWSAFESNVTLRIGTYDRGQEGTPPVSENYWTGWIQENFGDQYNITVEYVPVTRSDVMTDYALFASTQSLPTILMEYDYDKAAKWAADGYLTTFDMDEFAKVAPTYYANMVKNEQLNYSTLGDETYFAFAERPYWNVAYSHHEFARMDWLRAVGYDYVPVLYSEYEDAMLKIIEAGLSDHPAGGHLLTGRGSDQNYHFREYPLDEKEWAMYSSVNIPSLGWEPDYELIKRANKEYNNGIANPEYYITDEETNKASFINGDTYKFGGYLAADMDWLVAFYAQNPDAELALIPVGVVDEEGGTVPAYRSDNPFGMAVCFASTATEDEIKAAWMYMEWLSQEENLFTFQWGIEGENYVLNAETGLPESVGDYSGDYKQGYNNNKDYYCIVIEARNAGTIEDYYKNNSPKGLPQDFTQDLIDKYYANVEVAEAGWACFDPIFIEAVESDAEHRGNLVSLYIEYRDMLTMCTPEEFDALYADLTQKYLDAGYQEVLDERLQKYEEGKSTRLPEHMRK